MSAASVYNGTILSTSEDDDVNDLFIFCFVSKDSGMTDAMKLALEATKERFSDPLSTVIMTNKECLDQPKSKMKEGKKYFIFDEFDEDNAAFKYVSDVKSVYVLGTRAILSILIEGIKTTSGSFQIHNLSMQDLVITATSLPRDKKHRIQRLVSFMGGFYSDALVECCTHLISESVRSVKYEVANRNNVKIMHPNWIEKVWEKAQNLNTNVLADGAEYDCFKLPVFNGLCFTSTGISPDERNKLKSLVEENGGHYSASCNSQIDMLLMEEESVGSAKHKYALRFKKTCLSPAWVYDSIEAGYALNLEKYQHIEVKPSDAKPNKVSTPTKANNVTINKFCPDNTVLSEISHTTRFERDFSIDETVSNASTSSNTDLAECQKVVKNISLQAAKKAGTILDGFSFYMSGFSAGEMQFLGKILNILGATKVDNLCHQVSHVLAGVVDDRLFKELTKLDNELPIVKVDWIQKMIDVKKFVSEDAFTVERPVRDNASVEKPSPASKKAIKSLGGTFKKPAVPKLDLDAKNEAEENFEMINQYLQVNPSNLASSASETSYDRSVIAKFLTGKNVFVYGCSSTDESMEIILKCEELGATLVDAYFTHTVDFIITPNVPATKLDHNIKKFKNLVNMLWLVESAEAGCVKDVLFYHKPLVEQTFSSGELPLENEKIVVSNYKGNGRAHIETLVIALGGEYTETLRRSDNAILISPDSQGKKFQSAKAWNLTVLKAEWLVECYERKRRVNEIPFLVGGTTASKNNVESNDSVILSSQDPFNISNRFDSFDPPVENFEDNDADQSTPLSIRSIDRLRNVQARTPDSPLNLSVSRLLSGMPTPQRELTRAVLLEANVENTSSPRKKRYQEIFTTPGNSNNKGNKNLALVTPELLRAPEGDFSFRPDSSPDSQWQQKRKIEALDQNHVPQPKRSKAETNKVEEPTPPFTHRRYDFFKSCLPDYDSPDPRTLAENSKKVETTTATKKTLDFDKEENVEDNRTLMEFKLYEERRQSRNMKKPIVPRKVISVGDEPSSSNTERIYPIESEALVEWNYTQQPGEEVAGFLYATNGLDPDEKTFVNEELYKLGCEMDLEKFTHLITKKPNRGEKYLTSIATGKFVIHVEFVRHCARAGRLVDMEQFEFGNPSFKPSLRALIDKGVERMFNAPYKWRQWIKELEIEKRFKDGAFTGFRFTIADSKEKPSLFSNVLKKGGGTHVELDFQQNFSLGMLKKSNIDYCFVENPAFLSSQNEAVLKKSNVKTVNVKFLNEYLSSNEPPSGFSSGF